MCGTSHPSQRAAGLCLSPPLGFTGLCQVRNWGRERSSSTEAVSQLYPAVLLLTWGTVRPHSFLSSLALSFSAAAQPYRCVWSFRYLSCLGKLFPLCTTSGLHWLPCQNEQELLLASSFSRAVLIDDGFRGDIWNNIVQQKLWYNERDWDLLNCIPFFFPA